MSWYSKKKYTVLKPANDNAGQDTAVLIVDVDDQWSRAERSGTTETNRIARRISELAPEFRKAGAALYYIYYGWGDQADLSSAHLYKAQYDPKTDTLVVKQTDSAFESSDIRSELHRRGHKTILGCGFNLSFCVMGTMIDGCDEFEVRLMRDLTTNGQTIPPPPDLGIGAMQRAGVIMTDSATELEMLRRRNNGAPSPA